MDGKDLLQEQLKIGDDISQVVTDHGTAQQTLSKSLDEIRALAPENVERDFSELVFSCNIEQDVLDVALEPYRSNKPDMSVDEAEKLLKNPKKRAIMFVAVYCHKNPGLVPKDVLTMLPEVSVATNYAEFEQQITDLLNPQHGFFTVTGEEPVVENNKFEEIAVKDRAESYAKQALKANLPADLVKRAQARVTAETNSYEKFEQIIDTILSEDEAQEKQEQARDLRLQRAIKNDLQKIWNDKNPVATLKSLLYKTYNTTAVEVPELCAELDGCPELKLNIYKKPVYSIIHQVEKDFVADAMNRCLAKWENNAVVEGIITNYLDSLGVPEDKREKNRASLLEVLPDNIRNQTAPDTWKQYEAVCIITQRQLGDESDITSQVFSNDEASVEFGARMETYIDDGVPIDAAQRQASEDYCHDMPEEQQISLFGKVGQFTGRAIRFKYEAAADMENLMRDSLGEYADQYFEKREAVKARKEELRRIKEESKAELARQKVEMKAEQAKERAERREEDKERQREEKEEERMRRREEKQMQRGAGYNNGYGNSRYQDSRYGANTGYGNTGMFGRGGGFGRGSYGTGGYGGYGRGGNFAPQIPLPFIMLLVHIVIGLLCFIFLGGAKTAFVAAGLLLASFGFFRKQLNEPNAIPMVLGGYGLVVVAFVFLL